MNEKQKVVGTNSIGATRSKAYSNPNLDPEVVNRRIEEAEIAAEEKKKTAYYVPKELKGLENLIFVGANLKDIKVGDFTFSLSTLLSKEQDLIIQKAFELPEQERTFFFKKGIVALGLKKINNNPISSYIKEDSFEEKMDIVGNLQQTLFDYLFEQINSMTTEAGKLLTVENVKK